MSQFIFPATLALLLAIPALTTATQAEDYQRGDDPRLRQIYAQCMLNDAERDRVEGHRLQRQVENDPNITTGEQIDRIANQYTEDGFQLFRYCMEAKGAFFDETCPSSSRMNRYCYSIPKTETPE
ncbi:hypothetical protein HGP14_01225 [Rhizobium sp. P32RR-XVIII]|uniref:hypothetical protein n=1 Tax=Rhizobium sp. P32RR-XVIII TaxID=2726738 RepID=UPI001456F320|nr:hypothetical protein [Rhizobium sp. P32RR-XVIII]NLS01991.1 hypothetical protein [Rhizobium sp. P32RR-XVIII]